MANEAYRAVFLRIHPTGKMVLSLTTEADGNEPQYAQLVARRARRPRARRQGRPRRHRPVRERTWLQHDAVARRDCRDLERDGEDPGQGAAARRACSWEPPPDSLTWSNGAWVSGDGGDAPRVGTIADIAMYAHGSGELPPGVEGGLDAQTVYRD